MADARTSQAAYTIPCHLIGITLFVVVHLTLVAIFPRTLVAMLYDLAAEPEEHVR